MKKRFFMGWVYELSDTAPTIDTPKNRALKLQNEIKDFIQRDGDTVKIIVAK